LQKDPNKRYNIKQVLEHNWIQRNTKADLIEKRRNSNFQNSFAFKLYSSSSSENN
jgi:hypothetical protein